MSARVLPQVFRNAVRSLDDGRIAVPSSCCRQSISVPTVRLFLELEVVREFAQKTIEFGTPNSKYKRRDGVL